MLKNFYAFMLVLAVSAVAVFAQGGTTSGINGRVLDTDGNPLAGATVKIVHSETATVAGAITNKNGKFNIVGLRPGGPYNVTVTMVGYEPAEKLEFNIALNQNLNMNFTLIQAGVTTKEIQVVADKNEIISSEHTGASQRITETEITNLPTVARSLHDYSRLSPLIVSSTSDGSNVGGRNSKYNNIQVDGAIMSDAFGLSSAGTPGGQAGAEPISLDAIQEFQVSVSPFDVRQGGFTGGLINAITRGGSNYYHGSVYGYGRNESFVGKSPIESSVIVYGANGLIDSAKSYQKNSDGSYKKDKAGNLISNKKRTSYPEYKDMTFGARIGGPILKDQLFFFANGEYKSRTEPQKSGLLGEEGAVIFPVSSLTMDTIANIAKNKYGYNPGSYSQYDRPTEDLKLFLRLDYNINEKNRLTLRHNFVNADQGNSVTRSRYTYSFDGMEYLFKSQQNQTVAQLNTVVSETMANEARLAYTAVRDKRDWQSASAFPEIDIQNLGVDGRATVQMGIERYSQANALDQDIIEFTDNFTWFYGDHTFTFGTTNQYVNFSNLFAKDAFGYWTFKSISDFEGGTPAAYYYSYLLPGGKERAEYSYIQNSLYAQDEWTVMSGLKVMFGLRADMYSFPDDPTNNPLIETTYKNIDLKYGSYKDLSTSKMPNPLAFSPRVGFNWDVNGDKTFQLRGGIGLFSGRTPGVWIGNQYANTGMDYGRIDISSSASSKILLTKEEIERNIQGLVDTTLSATKTTEVNLTDPNFKMPQIFRINFAADYQIMDGLVGTVEMLYGKAINDIMYQNINLKYDTTSTGSTLYAIDGRPMYQSNTNMVNNSFTRVIYLTNTNKGTQFSITAQLQKPYGQGFAPHLSANTSYTFSSAQDVNSATSSQAVSNWQYNHAVDPNNPDLTTSLFAINHRVMANVSYTFKYGKNLETTLGLFYEGRSGSPFSFLYYTSSSFKFDNAVVQNVKVKDANNDNYWSNDLAYIPGTLTEQNGVWQDNNMILANGNAMVSIGNGDSLLAVKALEQFLGEWDGLERGKINKRYSQTQPWRHQVDFRLSQVLPIMDKRLEITWDIMNVLNLLNSDWGHQKYVTNNGYSLFRFEGYDKATGKVRASYLPNSRGNKADDIYEVSDFWSRWQMQIGMRFTF